MSKEKDDELVPEVTINTKQITIEIGQNFLGKKNKKQNCFGNFIQM